MAQHGSHAKSPLILAGSAITGDSTTAAKATTTVSPRLTDPTSVGIRTSSVLKAAGAKAVSPSKVSTGGSDTELSATLRPASAGHTPETPPLSYDRSALPRSALPAAAGAGSDKADTAIANSLAAATLSRATTAPAGAAPRRSSSRLRIPLVSPRSEAASALPSLRTASAFAVDASVTPSGSSTTEVSTTATDYRTVIAALTATDPRILPEFDTNDGIRTYFNKLTPPLTVHNATSTHLNAGIHIFEPCRMSDLEGYLRSINTLIQSTAHTEGEYTLLIPTTSDTNDHWILSKVSIIKAAGTARILDIELRDPLPTESPRNAALADQLAAAFDIPHTSTDDRARVIYNGVQGDDGRACAAYVIHDIHNQLVEPRARIEAPNHPDTLIRNIERIIGKSITPATENIADLSEVASLINSFVIRLATADADLSAESITVEVAPSTPESTSWFSSITNFAKSLFSNSTEAGAGASLTQPSATPLLYGPAVEKNLETNIQDALANYSKAEKLNTTELERLTSSISKAKANLAICLENYNHYPSRATLKTLGTALDHVSQLLFIISGQVRHEQQAEYLAKFFGTPLPTILEQQNFFAQVIQAQHFIADIFTGILYPYGYASRFYVVDSLLKPISQKLNGTHLAFDNSYLKLLDLQPADIPYNERFYNEDILYKSAKIIKAEASLTPAREAMLTIIKTAEALIAKGCLTVNASKELNFAGVTSEHHAQIPAGIDLRSFATQVCQTYPHDYFSTNLGMCATFAEHFATDFYTFVENYITTNQAHIAPAYLFARAAQLTETIEQMATSIHFADPHHRTILAAADKVRRATNLLTTASEHLAKNMQEQAFREGRTLDIGPAAVEAPTRTFTGLRSAIEKGAEETRTATAATTTDTGAGVGAGAEAAPSTPEADTVLSISPETGTTKTKKRAKKPQNKLSPTCKGVIIATAAIALLGAAGTGSYCATKGCSPRNFACSISRQGAEFMATVEATNNNVRFHYPLQRVVSSINLCGRSAPESLTMTQKTREALILVGPDLEHSTPLTNALTSTPRRLDATPTTATSSTLTLAQCITRVQSLNGTISTSADGTQTTFTFAEPTSAQLTFLEECIPGFEYHASALDPTAIQFCFNSAGQLCINPAFASTPTSPSATANASSPAAPTSSLNPSTPASITSSLSATHTGSTTGTSTAIATHSTSHSGSASETSSLTTTSTGSGTSTETVTSSATTTASASPAASASDSASLSTTATGSGTSTMTGTISSSPSVSATGSGSETSTGSITATTSSSHSGSISGTSSETTTRTSSGTGTTTASPSPSTSASDTSSLSTTTTGSGTRTGTASSNPSVSATVTTSASHSGSASGTSSLSATATGSGTMTGTASSSPSISATGSGSETSTGSATATTSASHSGSASDTSSITATRTSSGTDTTTASPSPSTSASDTSSLSVTATGSGTRTGTASSSPSISATGSGSETSTGSITATTSASHSGSASGTSSAIATHSSSGTNTATASPSASASASDTSSLSATATGSGTRTGTASSSPSVSATGSGSETSTSSATATTSASHSGSISGSSSVTATRSSSGIGTTTASPSPFASASDTSSLSATATGSGTGTLTGTASSSPSVSTTATTSVSHSGSASDTSSATATRTSSGTSTTTASPSPAASASDTSSLSATATGSGTMTGTVSSSPSISTTGSESGTNTNSITATASASHSGSISGTSSETTTRTSSGTGTTTASPSASASASDTSSLSATATGSGTGTLTGTASSSPSVSTTGSESQTRTGSMTATASPSPSKSASGTLSQTATGSGSETRTSSVTATASPSASASDSGTLSQTATGSGSETRTSSVTATASPSTSASDSSTLSQTATSTGSETRTGSVTASPSPSASASDSGTLSQTATGSGSETTTGSITATASPSASASDSGTLSQTATGSGSETRTSSVTATASPSASASASGTLSQTATGSSSETRTSSVTATASPSTSASNSGTLSQTATGSGSETTTGSITATASPSASESASGTLSQTSTGTGSETSTITTTASSSASPSATESETRTNSATASASLSTSNSGTSSETATSTSSGTVTTSTSPSPTATRHPFVSYLPAHGSSGTAIFANLYSSLFPATFSLNILSSTNVGGITTGWSSSGALTNRTFTITVSSITTSITNFRPTYSADATLTFTVTWGGTGYSSTYTFSGARLLQLQTAHAETHDGLAFEDWFAAQITATMTPTPSATASLEDQINHAAETILRGLPGFELVSTTFNLEATAPAALVFGSSKASPSESEHTPR